MCKSVKLMAGFLFFIAAVFVGELSAPSDLYAQQPGGLQQQIQGNWTLISIYNEWADGRKVESFGSAPKGSMILTPDGRFSIFLIKKGIPKFASNNRVKGTAAENRAVIHGSTAYYGSYKVLNDKDGVVNLIVEGSTFPNWDGQKQTRFMSVTGDILKVVNPASAIGGKAYIIWKRAK
jgi:hypothetical protein